MSGPVYFWSSSSGCLLPFLIILNLLFGKLIFVSTGLWLGIEAVLVIVFILKIKFMVSRISRQLWPEGQGSASDSRSRWAEGQDSAHGVRNRQSSAEVIDIQGQEIKDNHELK